MENAAYMSGSRPFAFAVPGDLATPTGGYAYDRRMIAELAALGWHADVIDLGPEFPRPSAAARTAACECLMRVPPGRCVVVDGLALGVIPEIAAELAKTHGLVALIHHPLALETGLSATQAAALRDSERASLAAAHHVVVTGAATARLLVCQYAVDAARITVAPPGVDQVARMPSLRGGTVGLLSVGAIVPRKGYDVLLAALAKLEDLPWRLTIVGAYNRSPETVAELNAALVRFELSHRIRLAGTVSSQELAAHYASADVFVLASRHEGYGMAFAEAIAHGLPVIGTTAGAIPDTVPPGAGILVPPDDSDALAVALRRVIDDAGERANLAAGARDAAADLPSWRGSATIFAHVLEAVS